MAHSIEMRDVAEVTANVLEAEKRGLAESQAKFQADFEAREARFNADLEALATQKPKGPATQSLRPAGFSRESAGPGCIAIK